MAITQETKTQPTTSQTLVGGFGDNLFGEIIYQLRYQDNQPSRLIVDWYSQQTADEVVSTMVEAHERLQETDDHHSKIASPPKVITAPRPGVFPAETLYMTWQEFKTQVNEEGGGTPLVEHYNHQLRGLGSVAVIDRDERLGLYADILYEPHPHLKVPQTSFVRWRACLDRNLSDILVNIVFKNSDIKGTRYPTLREDVEAVTSLLPQLCKPSTNGHQNGQIHS